MKDLGKAALILVGYQNEYFQEGGRLYSVIEETLRVNSVVENTLNLIQSLSDTVPVIVCPTYFTKDYSELTNPVGILRLIQESNALQIDEPEAALIDELKRLGDRVEIVEGKRGFNAFASTALNQCLRERGIESVVIAGAMTSVCVDSTGRHAQELGYRVFILSDCTVASSLFEQNFYCESIFPSYATVLGYQDLIPRLLEE